MYSFPISLYLCGVWHAAAAASGVGRADHRRDEDTHIFSSVSAGTLCDAIKKEWKVVHSLYMAKRTAGTPQQATRLQSLTRHPYTMNTKALISIERRKPN